LKPVPLLLLLNTATPQRRLRGGGSSAAVSSFFRGKRVRVAGMLLEVANRFRTNNGLHRELVRVNLNDMISVYEGYEMLRRR
jgi:hypothetical protein